jgi:hypothetical protein
MPIASPGEATDDAATTSAEAAPLVKSAGAGKPVAQAKFAPGKAASRTEPTASAEAVGTAETVAATAEAATVPSTAEAATTMAAAAASTPSHIDQQAIVRVGRSCRLGNRRLRYTDREQCAQGDRSQEC